MCILTDDLFDSWGQRYPVRAFRSAWVRATNLVEPLVHVLRFASIITTVNKTKARVNSVHAGFFIKMSAISEIGKIIVTKNVPNQRNRIGWSVSAC